MLNLYVSDDTPRDFMARQSLRVDHIHLKVSNLQEAVEFYQSILGFGVIEIDSGRNIAFLGAAEPTSENMSALLVLDQVKTDTNTTVITNTKRREAGLYHFAILLPERRHLASFLRHIQKNLDPKHYEGMADHAVSEAIYLHDPDYNGIEVYRDRDPSEWKWNNEHKVYMVTEPLNVDSLLGQHENEIWRGLPPFTTIGHVHLHVRNLQKAKKFYHQLLGLDHTATYPGAYFFAADNYHHHIATNIWLGTNILKSSSDDHSKPGLDHYALRFLVNSENDRKKLMNHILANGIGINKNIDSDKKNDSPFYIHDPDGIKIELLFI